MTQECSPQNEFVIRRVNSMFIHPGTISPQMTKLPHTQSIFKQVLILVLVPLLVGTLVLSFLQQLFATTEAVWQEARQQTNIVETMNETMQQWAIASSTKFGVAVENNKQYETDSEKSNQTLRGNFFELKRLAGDQPDQLKTVQWLEEIFKEEFAELSNLPHSSEHGMELATLSKLPRTLGKIYLLRTEIKKILLQERIDLQKTRYKQRASLQVLKLIAYTFIGLNIILGILLANLFSKSIGARLKILIYNANCLPRLELPTTHLGGDDELSYLDRVLTNTAERLKDAAAHRQAILGMVAHDIRSPLMASQANIQFIEEIAVDYDEDALIKLESAYAHIQGIITFVQDLLSVQKMDTSIDVEQNVLREKNSDVISLQPALTSDASKSTPACKVEESTSDGQRPAQDGLPGSVGTISLKATSHGRSEKQAARLTSVFLRPQMFHKGLFLIMAPLLLQTGFLLFLNNQLLNAEALAIREQRSTDINILSNLASMNMACGAIAQGLYLLTSKSRPQSLARKNFDELFANYGELQPLVEKDVTWAEYINLTTTSARHQISRLLSMKPGAPIDEIVSTFTDVGEVKERSKEAFAAREKGQQLLARNLSDLREAEFKQKHLASVLNHTFIIAIASNFAVALLLLYFYKRNTSQRLGVLVCNASLIDERDSLQAADKGSDEIAYLDMVLHQAKIQLEQASAQRALMMNSLVDKMRSPLSVAQAEIKEFARLSEESCSDKVKQMIKRIEFNIDRVLKLIDDLLFLETLQIGKVDLKLASCDIRQVADDAAATLTSLANKKQISITNECESTTLLADRARVAQVIINYLANAIKFSDERTTVRICSSVKNSKMTVYVIDQGPGMDSETRKRVFERFFQANTKQKKEGFGLGLGICQLLVHAHGGELGVESDPGKGSSFWFTLPLQH